MIVKNKLKNSWVVAILEDYLGEMAHHFKYSDKINDAAVTEVFPRDDGRNFRFEIVYDNEDVEGEEEEPTVNLYLQLFEDHSTNLIDGGYALVKAVSVSCPNGQKLMAECVRKTFGLFEVNDD